jgi:hypothetical protein
VKVTIDVRKGGQISRLVRGVSCAVYSSESHLSGPLRDEESTLSLSSYLCAEAAARTVRVAIGVQLDQRRKAARSSLYLLARPRGKPTRKPQRKTQGETSIIKSTKEASLRTLAHVRALRERNRQRSSDQRRAELSSSSQRSLT